MGKLLQIASSRRTWAWPYVLFMALFVVLPLILVAYYAFTDIEGDFTLRNITKFFTQFSRNKKTPFGIYRMFIFAVKHLHFHILGGEKLSENMA